MNTNCVENLNEISKLLKKIDNSSYTNKQDLLSSSSIGQHVRHITEFYICLLESRVSKVVNYDKRARNEKIENDIQFAESTIQEVSIKLNSSSSNFELKLEGNFTTGENNITSINSSFHRELAFCLEHCIHHQALIKIGLKNLGILKIVPSNFGVGTATIRHKIQCAQ